MSQPQVIRIRGGRPGASVHASATGPATDSSISVAVHDERRDRAYAQMVARADAGLHIRSGEPLTDEERAVDARPVQPDPAKRTRRMRAEAKSRREQLGGRSLDGLSGRQRRAMELWLTGLSRPEIAEAMGITDGAGRQVINRARRKLGLTNGGQ